FFAKPVFIDRIGYIQHLDTGTLYDIAAAAESRIFVHLIPGQLVDPTRPVAFLDGGSEQDAEETRARIATCFSVEDVRTFDQDPRFGASVLAEIASRALSPAVNDPGTAIDVISRALRVLAVWTEPVEAGYDAEVLYPNVHVPAIEPGDIFDDLFTPIARDGAAIVEVGIRLQKAFATLANFRQPQFRAAAERHSKEALDRAAMALGLEGDLHRLQEAAKSVRDTNDLK
ncbi:MAG: DUF2254 domain-containing protein, partial [Proteobacteria bacterium]|nr:DUF2254 domain-containing protein [Pseudomonadota bacterium]